MSALFPPADVAIRPGSQDVPPSATDRPASLFGVPTIPAKATRRDGNRPSSRFFLRFNEYQAAPVEGVRSYNGFTLLWFGEEYSGNRYEFYAVRDDATGECAQIDVSRWCFHPTNARFRWLVDNNFPTRKRFCVNAPITDEMIDGMAALQGPE